MAAILLAMTLAFPITAGVSPARAASAAPGSLSPQCTVRLDSTANSVYGKVQVRRIDIGKDCQALIGSFEDLTPALAAMYRTPATIIAAAQAPIQPAASGTSNCHSEEQSTDPIYLELTGTTIDEWWYYSGSNVTQAMPPVFSTYALGDGWHLDGQPTSGLSTNYPQAAAGFGYATFGWIGDSFQHFQGQDNDVFGEDSNGLPQCTVHFVYNGAVVPGGHVLQYQVIY
jgi:hypothetical protein